MKHNFCLYLCLLCMFLSLSFIHTIHLCCLEEKRIQSCGKLSSWQGMRCRGKPITPFLSRRFSISQWNPNSLQAHHNTTRPFFKSLHTHAHAHSHIYTQIHMPVCFVHKGMFCHTFSSGEYDCVCVCVCHIRLCPNTQQMVTFSFFFFFLFFTLPWQQG